MRKLLFVLLGLLVVGIASPVAVIAFSAPSAPPAMVSMAKSTEAGPLDYPAARQFEARDGARLQYYAYPAYTRTVAVLVHASAGSGTGMHRLAEALRAAGITVYALDIRGHGGSGRRGDIDYVGQLDDDLADFVGQLGPRANGEIRTLVGFSAGAGFTLRFAGGPQGGLFDGYVFLAPILPGTPTLRPNAGGWTNIAIPRLVTIASLGRFGIRWFDGLPVISYAIAPDHAQAETGSYSFRLMANFGAGRQHQTYLENIRKPAAVLVGDADEQVVADQFAPLLARLAVNIPVTVLPGLTHTDMIHRPEAFQAIIREISLRN
jgi:pimeloyl-ACP methyl ester carboxylesterase